MLPLYFPSDVSTLGFPQIVAWLVSVVINVVVIVSLQWSLYISILQYGVTMKCSTLAHVLKAWSLSGALFPEIVETFRAGVLTERHRSLGTSIPLKVTSSLLSSSPSPSHLSHNLCSMATMRWPAHSAIWRTECLKMWAKISNFSQASFRYSVTVMRKATPYGHKCSIRCVVWKYFLSMFTLH